MRYKIKRTEQHIINHKHVIWGTINTLCFYSKNLYNEANYIIRQEFIKKNQWVRYYKLCEIMKTSINYTMIGSNVGQQTLKVLDQNWKSFIRSIAEYKKHPNKFLSKPKIPKYKNKKGRFPLLLDSNKVKLKDGYLYFCWKPLKQFNKVFKTRAQNRIVQCRFIPRGNDYIMEIVYEIEMPETRPQNNRIVSIDLGVNNFITMVNNIGKRPIIIKGGIIKSINQYYNKQKALLQSNLKKKHNLDWSNKLQKLTNKRFEKIKYEMHCISKKVADYCELNNIDTLIVGHNKEWKQNNAYKQNFTYIPYNLFIQMLSYKCQNKGVNFIETEESYTSGTSFLDNEMPTKENYNRDRRIYRGLFKSNKGQLINADVNGAYQIIKKVFPEVFAEGIEGIGLCPIVHNYKHPIL